MKRTFLSALVLLILMLSPVLCAGQTKEPNNNKEIVAFNKQIDEQYASTKNVMKPVIAISSMRRADGGSSVPGTYIRAIEKSGGIPLLIPVNTNTNDIRRLLEQADGLLMTGGEDVAPSFYNEKILNETVAVDSVRDLFDLSLIKLAADKNIPLLGICRGMQLVNVAFGGTLYQDIPAQYESSITHKPELGNERTEHRINIVAGTKLATILKIDSAIVNSFHHQSVKNLAPGFRVTAASPDGIIEGIEACPNRNIFCVQWHPESMIVRDGDSTMIPVFDFFIRQASTYHKAKEIHKRITTVDTHADTPLCFIRIPGFEFGKRDSNEVNLPKMEEGMLDGIFLAAYTAQGARDKKSSEEVVKYILRIIDSIYSQAARNADKCEIAYTPDDLQRLKAIGKKAIFIGIENGYGIGKDINNLKMFKDRGVNYITLSHTKDNDICDTSSDTRNEWGGLSPFGHEVVREMNRLGIIVDVSHVHENTFWDVIKESKAPIIASHSSVRALCDHDRNLTDEQLKAIKKINGVVQLCPVDIFVSANENEYTLERFMEHIDYAVKLIGIDHIGIGTDFDGGGGLEGLRGANDLVNITVKLIERGYSEADIAKIWGGNFMRVLSQVQAMAGK